MSTLVLENHWTWRLYQYGGGYGAPPNLRVHEFNLAPDPNGFFSIHASLSRASGGGEAAIGITEFTDSRGQTVVAANETEWVPLALTTSGRFTVAAMAKGASMTGSIRIQVWRHQ